MKKQISLITVFVLLVGSILAQTVSISPQVLNSAGDHRVLPSGVSITDNVGEPFTESIGYGVLNMMITQGFLQPETVTPAGFTLSAIQQDIQCLDKEDDAFIDLTITSSVAKFDVKYFWSNGLCPNNDCAKVDTLKAGTYDVKVALTYTTNVGIVKKDSISRSFVIRNATQPCIVKVFSGISANSDNQNDVFTIENIKEFPKNKVSIFNRWGNMLAEIDGYDQNIPEKSWPSADELLKLPASTYFYIVQLGDGSGSILKGWVELIKD